MRKRNTRQVSDEKKPIAPVLKQLKLNQTEVYPISRYTVVKSCASLTGLTYGMEFKTSANRENGIVLVTRIG